MSDALCALATGSGFSTRKYYTDNESRTFKNCSADILNGIGEFANRPDLLSRAVEIKLKAFEEGERKTEAEVKSDLERLLPGVIAHLFDCISCALRKRAELPTSTTLRMADAAHWIAAAEPATGELEGSIVQALERGQQATMIERVVNDPLVQAILDLIETIAPDKGEIEFTVGELHAKLKPHDG